MRYVAILLTVFTVSAFAGDYYVDAQNGSDTTGDGSAGNPWQTIQHAFDSVSAYDGDGADTLNLIGVFEEDATTQSDDDQISILTVDGYLYFSTIDVTNVTSSYISITAGNSTSLFLGESSTVYRCNPYSSDPPGAELTVEANYKNNITISGTGYPGSFAGYLNIDITGGSGHTILNNDSLKLYIYVNGISSSSITGNNDLFLGTEGIYTDGYIHSYNSEVEIYGNTDINIEATGDPDIHDNRYAQMEISDVPSLELYNNDLDPPFYEGSIGDVGVDFNLPSDVTCDFYDNTASIETTYDEQGPLYNINSGKVIIRNCSFLYNGNDYNRLDSFAVNGGIADFGGGPLGSTGGNSFEGPDWDPDYSAYLINNLITDDTFALYNTWDAETTAEMDGRYYDTTNVNKLYDKWEDESKGFVIWSEPDPDGPIPAFDLLSPADGEHVADTPTLDWEDMPDCPWITFSHFDLYLDDNPGFVSPDIYSNLTQSEYTFADPLDDGTYYWKVKVFDTGVNERWSEQTDWSFVVESGELGDFSLLSPPSGATVNTLRPTLDWEDAQPTKWRFPETSRTATRAIKHTLNDKLAGDARKRGKAITLDHYELFVDIDPGYGNPTIMNDLAESTYTFDYDLDDGEVYYWKVKAVDSLDRELWCNELDWWFLVDIPEGIKSASLGEIKAMFR